MPVQQQMPSFDDEYSSRVAAANETAMSTAVNLGDRRLPAGLRGAVARLSSVYLKRQEEDGGKTPKGKLFFRASAMAVTPEEHNGQKVAGLPTSVTIPICDVPQKGPSKAQTFENNWKRMTDVLRMLGVAECPETGKTDPTGARTKKYWSDAIQMVGNPNRIKSNPTYIKFRTRLFNPPPLPGQKPGDGMVLEDWDSLAAAPTETGPGDSVDDSTPPSQGEYDGPPTEAADGLPPGAPPATDADTASEDEKAIDEVDVLVQTAMSDPDGKTKGGADAGRKLNAMALKVGWTEDEVIAADDWAAVGNMILMILNPPEDDEVVEPTGPTGPVGPPAVPTCGSKWNFARRDKDGVKLKSADGKELAAQQVEVVTVNVKDNTCTVKTTKDGKDVVNLRTKKPTEVKWEWLE